jgi:glutathione peroxidase
MTGMLRILLSTLLVVLALASNSAFAEDRFGGYEKLEGGTFPANAFTGQVVLVVNTASYCGYTRQYEGLQTLWAKYREKGLVVLGMPSNDFSQEPDSNAKIKDFCEATFGVEFPMTGKQSITGAKANAFYKWAAEQTGPRGVPTWNFHKILVGRNGEYLAWFPTELEPSSTRMTRAIEAALEGRKLPAGS